MIQVYARHIINELHGCLWIEVAYSAQYTMREYTLHWVAIVAHTERESFSQQLLSQRLYSP